MPDQDYEDDAPKRKTAAQKTIPVPPPVEEAANQVIERGRETFTDVKMFLQNHKVELLGVTSVILLFGVLRSNRKTLKFMTAVMENHYANRHAMRADIEYLKNAGQLFTYYPGLGVYVEGTS